MKIMLLSALFLVGGGVFAEAYEDDYIMSSDASVRLIVLPGRNVYVFTNTEAAVSVTAKSYLTVARALIVAGGGSGGYNGCGAGGGGGGVIYDTTAHEVAASTVISLSVGAGGLGRPDGSAADWQGKDSVLTIGGTTWTAIGGGYGGGWGDVNSSSGGSGGGNSMGNAASAGTPGQGYAGANGPGTSPGGGGGAGEPGHQYGATLGGVGGEGRTIDITGVGEVYGSGGGAGTQSGVAAAAGKGGTNAGAGDSSGVSGGIGHSAVPGFGGGGGGGYSFGGAGGSGTVILSIVTGFAYEDDYVASSDDSLSRVFTADGLTYVFRNTDADANLQVKMPVTLTRRLIVAGGGGGGSAIGGGGGGGGVIADESDLALAEGDAIAVTVGAGGISYTNGDDSSLTVNGVEQKAIGGGRGGNWGGAVDAGPGGSGGGQSMTPQYGAAGVDGQGHTGGGASSGSGGGGGAGSGGMMGTDKASGHGGEGLTNDITGVACVYGSGGGGGYGSNNKNPAGKGGTNAGDGGASSGVNGGNGVDGFGGGGGGAGQVCSGGKGGNGIVAFTLKEPGKGVVFAAGLGGLEMNVPDGGAFLADGEQMEFVLLPLTNSLGMVTRAVGYTLETRNAATGAWSAPVAYEGNSYAHAQSGTDSVRITWQLTTEVAGKCFEDEVLETNDETLKRIGTASGVAYVFGRGTSTAFFKAPVKIVRKLIVAGGGGGGNVIGGGGGGGGVIVDDSAVDLAAGECALVTVGAGGLGQASGQDRELSLGGDSVLTIKNVAQTAKGGGYGGNWGDGALNAAKSGGSGGGESMSGNSGGQGTAGQGHVGGGAYLGSGGGGGAAGEGQRGTGSAAGHGGEGLTNDITGVACVYGSGGGGGYGGNTPNPAGRGGTNAGDGGVASGVNGVDAVDGFGGGGGGAGHVCTGGKGGDGTVILLVRPIDMGVLVVDSDQAVDAQATTPSLGVHYLADGDALTCTAVDQVDETMHVTYACTGATLQMAVDGGWDDASPYEGNSVAYGQVGNAISLLTWQWRARATPMGFQDRYVETSAVGVERRMFVNEKGERELVYIFNHPSQDALVLKQPLLLIDRLIVAGGGGGGGAIGGGGGGGGVIADDSDVDLEEGDVLAVKVGAGGISNANGDDSVLTVNGVEQKAIGGGRGGNWGNAADAGTGGSGGGQSMAPAVGATGVAGQGFAGGGANSGSGGGGGASGSGAQGTVSSPGNGGEGLTSSITGVACVYGAGGGGGYGSNNKNPAGKGGTNAGDGGASNGIDGGNGVDGFGGGGGGAGQVCSGGKGGNGTVILRFNTLRAPDSLLIIVR